MNLREENNLMSDLDYKIFDIIAKVKNTEGYPIKRGVIEIKQEIEKRIDEMIEIDNQTITMKHGTQEGKIAAQASRNTLTLIKELLKQ